MRMDFSEAPTTIATAREVDFGFDNTYARLPQQFFASIPPKPVAAPRLIKLNQDLARTLQLDAEALTSPEGVAILAGNRVAAGSQPLAMAYAGHQFGHFVPQLGDGRANLLGEVVGVDGRRYDIQLKGSGPTPFSRRGDGRAALGPVLREYIVSEAMATLGVPTTRALAAVTTGQPVFRETMQPGAILTRVAASHLRVGTFQYFAARGDKEALRTLAGYAMSRHYPDAAGSARPFRALLEGVIGRQARLVARWMSLGFIHGIMNTDNTSISGETIDYGPCAFMEAYNPGQVFSSIDHQGRYAYSNQPHAMLWNLTRLAEALLPLLVEEQGSEEAAIASEREALEGFSPQFESARQEGLRRKLGLLTEQEGDTALCEDLLDRMAKNEADFTLTFRRLAEAAVDPAEDARVAALFSDPSAFQTWAIEWRQRIARESRSSEERASSMRRVNPLFIPRNHLVQAVISAGEVDNFGPFEKLLGVLTRPYDAQPGNDDYTVPATAEQYVHQTFCGT